MMNGTWLKVIFKEVMAELNILVRLRVPRHLVPRNFTSTIAFAPPLIPEDHEDLRMVLG
jgi:hypothetical protein